jgi:hypothetical protein
MTLATKKQQYKLPRAKKWKEENNFALINYLEDIE